MKTKNDDEDGAAEIFIPYNDDNIQHVLAGPEYGQPWRTGHVAWNEFDSIEFKDMVEAIQRSINAKRIRI